tara:strand:+ start:265 stop:2214 length:1950 start_codon:yes stop_codon:yes gene_type:complete
MSKLTYNISQVDPIGFKKITESDARVVDTFEVNDTLDLTKNKIELHIYSIDEGLLESHPNFSIDQTLSLESSAGNTGTSEIKLDPEKDAKNYGYHSGGIINVYNFLNDLYSEDNSPVRFFIQEISPDRTELLLLSNMIENDKVVEKTDLIIEKLQSTAFYNDFRLNLGDNNIVIGTNIKNQVVRDFQAVIVKLYQPLEQSIELRQVLTIEEVKSDSIAYEILSESEADEIEIPFLKGPNFSLQNIDNPTAISSDLFSYSDLFNFDNVNNFRELKSLVAEQSIDISIDYSDYSDFINFSSAEERLRNFKYKLDLLEAYQASIDVVEAGDGATIPPSSVSGSRQYYKGLINDIIENFDHYDRHLYYESGSTSWPKVNDTKPYINATGSATGSFYSDYLVSSSNYDVNNVNQLINTVPSYIRDDSDNAAYQLFVNLVAQHFDNIWVYTKAVTDKYNADNRVDKGISKDLVEVALKNFGIKVYNSSKSTLDLFQMFTGQLFDTGSENINTLVSASNNATSEDIYRKEIHKRIYHNLPLLLKSKGTEKGIRVLGNAFGIPTLYSTGSVGLKVRVAGGNNTSENVNLGQFTLASSSLAKIRIDDTGSVVTGNTLSRYSSINKRDEKYSQDINNIEVGYSPTDILNEKIIEYLNGL